MTISYLAKFPDGTHDSVPVVTNETFRTCWLPIIEAHNLFWLELFYAPSLNVTPEIIPEVLDQLAIFYAELDLNTQPDAAIAVRVNMLVEAIKRLQNREYIYVDVG